MKRPALIFLILSISLAQRHEYEDEHVRAIGKLTCNGEPYEGAKVRLYDEDFVTPNDQLAEVITEESGTFDVEATTSQLTWLNPVLTILHRCNLTKYYYICYLKVEFPIPTKHIGRGRGAKAEPYNLGTLELKNRARDLSCMSFWF